jgi:hypothetical protein
VSRTVEELFKVLGVFAAYDISVRTLQRGPLSADASLLQEMPHATYVASSASKAVGVDFVEVLLLVGRGARVSASVLEMRRSQ